MPPVQLPPGHLLLLPQQLCPWLAELVQACTQLILDTRSLRQAVGEECAGFRPTEAAWAPPALSGLLLSGECAPRCQDQAPLTTGHWETITWTRGENSTVLSAHGPQGRCGGLADG